MGDPKVILPAHLFFRSSPISLTTRSEVEATISRVPGTIYETTENNTIKNLYKIQFINKTYEAVSLSVKLENKQLGTLTKAGEQAIDVAASSPAEGIFIVELPRSELDGMKTELEIGLYREGKRIDLIRTNFIGPAVVN